MLKIGDFSRVAHVTVKALRLYGRMGLLRPVWVDRYNGYRFYSLEQLPRLNRILALKELGFSLDQIAAQLDRSLSVDELRSILRQKRMELEDRLRAEQARLALLETRIEQIDRVGSLPEYEVALKCVPEQVALTARATAASQAQLSSLNASLRRRMLEEMDLLGLRPTGGWISLVHNTAYTEHNIDLEVAIPVDLPAAAARRGPLKQKVRLLPGLPKAACVVHAAPVEDLDQAYAALFHWAQSNPWRQAGAIREVCHTDPAEGLATCPLVELQMPVEAFTPPSSSSVDSNPKENGMDIKLIEKPAFMVVGMKYVGKNENQEIGQMWGRFNQVAGAIAQDVKGCYGVCSMLEGVDDGTFEYLSCFELDKIDKVPDWAVVKMLPANTYAIFEHVGAANGLRDTYHKIYNTWLPQSGYEPMGGYDMEVYTDEFKDFAPDSKMYIYVPVKKK